MLIFLHQNNYILVFLYKEGNKGIGSLWSIQIRINTFQKITRGLNISGGFY